MIFNQINHYGMLSMPPFSQLEISKLWFHSGDRDSCRKVLESAEEEVFKAGGLI